MLEVPESILNIQLNPVQRNQTEHSGVKWQQRHLIRAENEWDLYGRKDSSYWEIQYSPPV